LDKAKVSPLRLGLLLVALAYFLFTAHELFTLQWVGEWNRLGSGQLAFNIFIEDITATPALACRFIAGLIALAAVVYCFRKPIEAVKTLKYLRWIVVFEAIYWFGLLTSAIVDSRHFTELLQRGALTFAISGVSLTFYVVGEIIESTVLPILLLVLAFLLSPKKPQKRTVKPAFAAGAAYIFVFWLLLTSAWLSAIQVKGISYLTSYPQNLVSFVLTAGGLLALGIYVAAFAFSTKAASFGEVNPKVAGGMITLLGVYFLWNYVSWIVFGTPYSDWVAWFLGHTLDLWMLALPLIGLPLMLYSQFKTKAEA
jgi:hypothetical protein